MNVKKFNKFTTKDYITIAYMNDIKGSESAPMSKEEEKELLEKYYSSDTTEAERIEIRKKIAMAHQRFIYDMAKCYANGDNELTMELVNVGTIGLYETFDNFDMSKDNKFMTYAQYYIRRAINHFMKDENLIVRPSNNARITPKVKEIEEEYMRVHGTKPDIFEVEHILEEKYGVKLSDRNDIFGAKIERIEDPAESVDDDTYIFENSKKFTEYASVENDYAVQSEKEGTKHTLQDIISRLPEREATIIKMAYGMGDYNKECTNEDIGEVLGLTSERVRQLRQLAEKKIKNMYQRVER